MLRMSTGKTFIVISKDFSAFIFGVE